MKYISLFSGIEAATVAWEPLGWQPLAFSEIEPFPCAVLARHYPNVPNLGDVTKFKEWPDLGPVDLICGGAPCQAFSVAGLRAGLADPRGNLTLTYLAVIDRYRPQWVLFENVPGILSSTSHDAPDPCPPPNPMDMGLDGQEVVIDDEYNADETHAFSAFVRGLSELGYGLAYRVLDAQFCRASGLAYAVPQRRRRVFVVGYFGDWRRAAAVLFDGASLRGDSPPRREAGQNVAPTISARTKGGGGLGTDFDLDGGLIDTPAISVTLTARDRKGPLPEADLSTVIVSHALRAEGFDASEDGTGRGTPLVPIAFHGTQDPDVSGDVTRAEVQAVAFAENSRGELRLQGGDGQVAPQLTTGGGKPGQGQPCIAETWAVRRLTPIECHRLQGFPDDYLGQVIHRGKPPADGPQYKALGNSMAVNVMRVIGERIAMVDALAGD